MHQHKKWTAVLLVAAFGCCGLSGGSAWAQVRIAAEAFPGEPFGVGRITVDIPHELLPVPLGVDGLELADAAGRVLYPALSIPRARGVAKDVLESTPLLEGGPVRQQLRGLLGDILGKTPPLTIFFLFRGAGPLELSVRARTALPLTVVPQPSPLAHRQLLQAWWQQYTAGPKFLEKRPDYPPVVHNYLEATLARRLNFALPKRDQSASPRELLAKQLGLMLGSESVSLALEQDRLLGLNNLSLPADQALPEPIDPPPLELPESPADVAIEPIALHVPAECFYIRFGTFHNFLWMQDTLARWGGDLQNLLATRGLNYGISDRLGNQLVLKSTALARLLGGTVIADVALVGNDMFFREGAAYGLLFQARNNLAVSTDFNGQRLDRRNAGGVSEQKLKIDGHEVSYLASPDGSVRSYYVVDGDYHFVTTSQALLKRFLEAAAGKGALGAAKEFRHARTIMPLARNDVVWIYFSDAFFRNFTAPHYRLEMVRRLQAQADIEIVQLATLAAATEGKPGGAIEKLIGDGLLPPDFGPRPDGSRTVLEGDEVYDSLRGRRRALLPVPDVPVGNATTAEVSDYRAFAQFYRENWGRMDPILIGLQRQILAGNQERVTIEARMSPFAAKHFEFLNQWAGPADKTELAPIPGDIARAELVLTKQHAFAGLRDAAIPPELAGERFLLGHLREVLVGYLGTTGELGPLGFLERPLPLPPDLRGVPRAPLGPLRQRSGPFTVYSLQPEVLATVTPQLRFQEAQRPAQLRVWIGDVSQAHVTPFVNHWGYLQSRETSLGNLWLLRDLNQQLHVPPKDCREAAEFLTGAKLVCPLDGQYVYREVPGEVGRWTSTALGNGQERTSRAPDSYLAQPLRWFRGFNLDATMTKELFSAHAEVIMQVQPVP